MSDRIAVMDQGRISQVGAPLEIYNRPATRFVSEFIGDINLFDGALRDGGRLATGDGLSLRVGEGTVAGGAATLALRPEKLRLADAASGLENTLDGTVAGLNFLGEAILYQVAVGERMLLALEANDGTRPVREPGSPVAIGWNAGDGVLLRA